MKDYKVILGEPVVVAMGPSYGEVGWGPWQFPRIFKDDDGRIMVSCHSGKDDERAYGKEPYWFSSDDNGKTWQRADGIDAPKYFEKCPNGDRLKNIECPPVPTPDGLFDGCEPAFTMMEGDSFWKVYRFDEIKPGYFEKKWKFSRLRAGEDTACDEYAPVLGWKNMPLVTTNTGTIPPFAFGRLRRAPDDTMWLTHYCQGIDPETGEAVGGLAQYFFNSKDNGASWSFASWLDPRKTDEAYVFCEGDMCWTQNGTAVALMRAKSSFYAISKDGGYTWDAPKLFDEERIAQPALISLGCGVTIGAIGRPGIRIRTSSHPDCAEWDKTIDIIPKDEPAGCCYTEFIALSDNEAMIVYSIFEYPDENGNPHKTILTRTITIEI